MLPARNAALGALIALALSGTSVARADTLYLKIDGVKGDAPESQPLGKGAFQLLTFTLTAEGEDGGEPGALKDVHFDMPVNAAAVQIFDLVLQHKTVPRRRSCRSRLARPHACTGSMWSEQTGCDARTARPQRRHRIPAHPHHLRRGQGRGRHELGPLEERAVEVRKAGSREPAFSIPDS